MTRPTGGDVTRRTFLERAAAVGGAMAGPWIVRASALGQVATVAPSDRITVGFLGVGGHGIGRNLQMFLHQADAQPVALCDVDRRQIDQALQTVRQKLGQDFTCQTTQDWREVVARDDIDAVMISTPDHWHVPMSIAALRAGKDVICEKPTLTLAEGRALADTVDRYGAVFQLSTEDRSLPVYHRMAELVRNGRIGKLQRIFVGLPAGPGNAGDPVPKPIPEGFDYEMWVGPAPRVPYRDGLHPFHWRWVSNFSGGMLADWGAHLLDTAQWANDTERSGPVEVEGTGKRFESGLYDTFHEFHLTYKYAGGVVMQVDSGNVALRFEGTDGWIGNNGWIGKLEASSQEILDSPIGPEETRLFTCPQGEHRNFLDCVKSRRDPYFPAEIGHRCCSVAHLGNIAMELGRTLRWDPEAEQFLDDPTANRMRARAYRGPWTL
ncbi:MAG: Gfo/Idh/MocA family oxidoreductase [Pirellulales bacterium]|nr:Gfo/Idh/MocA family oxidoreductase [Pirellulales bacterium]